jgi:hypothetical protein
VLVPDSELCSERVRADVEPACALALPFSEFSSSAAPSASLYPASPFASIMSFSGGMSSNSLGLKPRSGGVKKKIRNASGRAMAINTVYQLSRLSKKSPLGGLKRGLEAEERGVCQIQCAGRVVEGVGVLLGNVDVEQDIV